MRDEDHVARGQRLHEGVPRRGDVALRPAGAAASAPVVVAVGVQDEDGQTLGLRPLCVAERSARVRVKAASERVQACA